MHVARVTALGALSVRSPALAWPGPPVVRGDLSYSALIAEELDLLVSGGPMNCPKCAADMAIVRFQDIEVDRCTECQGLWFDHLEHEQLKQLAGSEEIDSGAPEIGRINNHVSLINCPVCALPLVRNLLAGSTDITYESCSSCHGLYFDAGEFRAFMNR
jgi:uncharacterized protein